MNAKGAVKRNILQVLFLFCDLMLKIEDTFFDLNTVKSLFLNTGCDKLHVVASKAS